MALGKTLEELSKQNTRWQKLCAYQALYDSLSDADKKALDAAWATNMPISIIIRALRQEGHKTSADSVRAHRKGLCKCPK